MKTKFKLVKKHYSLFTANT